MRKRRCNFHNIFMLYCFRWTVPFLDEKKAMSLRQLIRLLEEQGMVDLCYTEYDWNLNSMWCIHRGFLGIQGCICNVIQWHPLIPGAEQALTYPVNTIHWPNVDSMLGQQRRQWSNIDPTLACIVLTAWTLVDVGFMLRFCISIYSLDVMVYK